MNTDIRTLTNGRLELLLREVNQHLRLEQLAAQGITWLIAGGHSPIFAFGGWPGLGRGEPDF
jgi:hypothetical protein